jgi:hypothetical protein
MLARRRSPAPTLDPGEEGTTAMTDSAPVDDARPGTDASSDAPLGPGDGAASRGWPRRPRLLLGVVATAIVSVAAVAVLRQPPADPDGLVILYGDSLSLEASGAFVDALGRTSDAEVLLRLAPATSVCDARPGMDEDVPAAPDVVVIQYVGNNSSPCTSGPDGAPLTGRALADRTEADVRGAVEMWAAAGARVVLVGGPAAPGLPGEADAAITEAYNRVVNEWAGRDLGRVRYADAAATVSGADHAYAARLPCRADEGEDEGCDDGEVTVRSPDRIHFCPTDARDERTVACPVASPGAVRFGEEMARVARLALDPGY